MSKKENILVIWNDDGNTFSSVLKDRFGKDKVVVSYEQFKGKEGYLGALDALVVLAELSWNEKRLSEFSGIEILKKLRAERHLNTQVLFCSVLPEKYFYLSERHGRFDILKTPGHHFLQLPADLKTTLSKIDVEPIDLETLEDIVESTCNLEGMLNEEIHALKNAVIISKRDETLLLEQFKGKITAAIEHANQKFLFLFSNDPKVSQIKDEIISEVKTKITSQETYPHAIDIVGNFEGKLRTLLPFQEQQGVRTLPERPPWKILFVDDESHVLKRVQSEFEKRNITCEIVSSAEEVFNVLRDDTGRNRITALIVDYRLYGPDGRWKDEQGYSILRNVYLHKPNFLSFFALTAANRKALMRIQSTYQMRVIPYSKEDILSSSGAFNMFAERVTEEADRTYEAVCAQPQLTTWHQPKEKNIKPLKFYYRVHRASLDYEDAEKVISEKAFEYVRSIVTEYEKNDPQPQGHKYEFQASLDVEPDDPNSLEKFRIRLIGRRIAIGLYSELGFTRKGIFYAMRKQPYIVSLSDFGPENNQVSKKSIDALLATALALSIEDDFPDHLLVEERHWLHEKLNPDLNTLTEVYELLTQQLQDFQNKLKHSHGDPFLDIEILISNFDTAKKMLQLAYEAAERNRKIIILRDVLETVYDDQELGKALRISGLKSLLEHHGVGKHDQSEDGTHSSLGPFRPDNESD